MCCKKEVWGYAEELRDTYSRNSCFRLRKKIKKTFDDQNFIQSDKKGIFHIVKKKNSIAKDLMTLNINLG